MIAIDPGAQGGVAFYDGGITAATRVVKMPSTDREIMELLRPAQGSLPQDIYIENLVKFAGRNMPSSAMATYAGNWGFIKGAATAFGHRIILVNPKAWQKSLSLGEPKSHASKTAWKNHLKNRAEQLFPHIKVTLATADALLILEAARRGFLG
jgi:hypothetical protein